WFEGRPAGVRLPQLEEYYKIKEILELDNTYDEMMEEAEREKVGEKSSGIGQAFGDGEWKSGKAEVVDITAPATELARKYDGWGTALKPAHEPIIVVRKPLIDADTGRKLSVADCVEKYGTGAINIDGCRIGEGEDRASGGNTLEGSIWGTEGAPSREQRPTGGRFPANCITLDSDEFYSKYFDVAQANISPEELSKKASKKDRNSDWKGEEIAVGERNNVHPTVKPIDLMAWLVRLVTPEGGTVLDP